MKPFTGESLRNTGIQLSLDHAEAKCDGWQEKALGFLQHYIKLFSNKFKAEDFRAWAEENGLPKPPNLRAYGGIIVKASHQNLIRKVGYVQVKNPKAHCANAALWEPVQMAA